MGEAVEQRGCHFGVTKDACPFAEAEISGDDDAGAIIKCGSRRWIEENQKTGRV